LTLKAVRELISLRVGIKMRGEEEMGKTSFFFIKSHRGRLVLEDTLLVNGRPKEVAEGLSSPSKIM